MYLLAERGAEDGRDAPVAAILELPDGGADSRVAIVEKGDDVPAGSPLGPRRSRGELFRFHRHELRDDPSVGEDDIKEHIPCLRHDSFHTEIIRPSADSFYPTLTAVFGLFCYTVSVKFPFKSIMSALQPSADSVIGIDVGSAYLKVVQLRRKSGRAVLETYGSLALGPYAGLEIGRATHLPTQKISEALRDLMREAHVTSSHAGVAIPFEASLVTPIEMMVTSERELETAVPIEARKYVPVPISEVNLDWWVIPDEPGNPSADIGTKPSASEPA